MWTLLFLPFHAHENTATKLTAGLLEGEISNLMAKSNILTIHNPKRVLSWLYQPPSVTNRYLLNESRHQYI